MKYTITIQSKYPDPVEEVRDRPANNTALKDEDDAVMITFIDEGHYGEETWSRVKDLPGYLRDMGDTMIDPILESIANKDEPRDGE